MSWGAGYELDAAHPTMLAAHKHFYDSGIVGRTSWFGVPIGKCPNDMVSYANLFHAVLPDLVVETGTNYGGSAFYFAHLLDLLASNPADQRRRVLTIDPFPCPEGERPDHPRITYLHGSSLDPWIVTLVAAQARGKRVLVILDSVHEGNHVMREILAYAAFVCDGSYLVVEDTNLNGHPVAPQHGAGPMEAVEAFLGQTDDFVVDESFQPFGMSMSPRGFLRRVTGRPL